MPPYSSAIEDQMRSFYQSLSEKDRRRYAAIEATKLGYGGISYIARVLECDRHTVRQGLEELGDPEALEQSRIRRPGGGRKLRDEVIPELNSAFFAGPSRSYRRVPDEPSDHMDEPDPSPNPSSFGL